MSNWTHPICDTCWYFDNPDREPHRLLVLENPEREFCCICGGLTNGIYVRRDPSEILCGGVH